MNVAFVIQTLEMGGAERVLSLMANHWANSGSIVSVITFAGAAPPPFYPLDRRIRYIPLGISGESATLIDAVVNNLRRVVSIRKAIAQSSADIVISFMSTTNVVTLLATRFMAVPVVVSERTLPSRATDRPVWRALRRFAYSFASMLVVQSHEARRYFLNSLKRRVCIIPNPVRAQGHESAIDGGAISKPFVVCVGRLEGVKRFDHVIEAFARVRNAFPEWRLVIVGDGSLRDALKELASRLGISERVEFSGPVADPVGYLKHADLFVMSSLYEGFPNALLEAMACGLPVLTYDCPGGIRDIVQDGLDGMLVDSGNVGALANAMSALLADEEKRATLGRAATSVREKFALDRVMRIWECELGRLIGRGTTHA